MQLIWGENTKSIISQGRGWGNRTSAIFVEELHKTDGSGELRSMVRGQFVTDHCHLNVAWWQLNKEQNKKGVCLIWAGSVPRVHSQWKVQSRRESVSACSAQHPHNSLAYTTGPSPGTKMGALFLHMLKKIRKEKDSGAIYCILKWIFWHQRGSL